MMRTTILKIVKEMLFLSPMRRYFFPYFYYNMTAPELCFLCQCLERTRNVPGSILEVGCSNGRTTVFLNKYMDGQGIEKKYFAIDTFSGFVREDIGYETFERGKNPSLFSGFQFGINSQKWFDKTMRLNNIDRVKSIQADVNEFDFGTLGIFSFVLLDVDLYRPTRSSLKPLYDDLSIGGIIVVDDCNPNNIRWDGSNQAYNEFMEEISQPRKIVHGKLGIIEKRRTGPNPPDF